MAAPASAIWKLEDDSTFAVNCFPARGISRITHEGTGSWIVAYAHEQSRKFKPKPPKKDVSQIQQQNYIDGDEKGSLAAPGKRSEFVNNLTTEFLLRHHHVDSINDLCSVNISDCDLEFDETSDFSKFKNVAYVNAAENLLTVRPFSTFPNLRELEMPVNGVRNIGIQPGDFATLQVLDLSYNNLSASDMLSLGYLPKLKVLTLTGNGLSQIHPDLCQPFSLDEDSDETYTRFQSLEVLMLDDNRLHDMSTFAALAALPSLRELNLDKNEITLVPYLKVVGERVLSAAHSHSQSRPTSVKLSNRSRPSSKSGKNKSQISNETISGIIKPLGLDEETSEKKEDLSEKLQIVDDKDTAATTDISSYNNTSSSTPPFQHLRILSLANNKISEEEHLLAIAAWPALQALVLHGNPLINNSKGEPPLLSHYLHNRLGISIMRFKPRAPVMKPALRVPDHDRRRVSSRVPKIMKHPFDVMLEEFRKPAIGHVPRPPVIDKNPDPVQRENFADKCHLPNKESDQDNVFLTQVQDEYGEEVVEDKQTIKTTEKSNSVTEKPIVKTESQIMKEFLQDAKPDPDIHENLSIQGNVKMLRQILHHPLAVTSVTAPPEARLRKFKYQDNSIVTVERLKHDVRSQPKPNSKLNKSKKLNDALSRMRDRPAAAMELPLITALNDKTDKTLQLEADSLLNEIEKKYRVVREESLKASRQAQRALEQTKQEVANLQNTILNK
ncbi:X-ray radiation resistance-associated protein 1-like [Styela clava]